MRKKIHPDLIGAWNNLPDRVMKVGSIEVFRRELDCYLKRKTMQGYRNMTGEWNLVECILRAPVQTQWAE